MSLRYFFGCSANAQDSAYGCYDLLLPKILRPTFRPYMRLKFYKVLLKKRFP